MISACLIAKDTSPSLEAAIASVRGHVDEVILVFTRRKESDEPRVEGVDVVDYFDACNAQTDCPPSSPCHCKTGEILDFSAARNHSFELARNEWIVWLDSDDLIESQAHLEVLCDEGTPVLSPYEYQYDSNGHVERLLHLSRVVPRTVRWSYPIHETIVDTRPGKPRFDDTFTWKHQATRADSLASGARNLRMHLHWQRDPRFNRDPRFIYHFGDALYRTSHFGEALTVLEKHAPVEPSPEWRCQSAMRIATILPPRLGLPWAHKALEAKPTWPAPWFCLARVYHALSTDPERHDHTVMRQASTVFAEAGLRLPLPKTVHTVDPTERDRIQKILVNSVFTEARGALS